MKISFEKNQLIRGIKKATSIINQKSSLVHKSLWFNAYEDTLKIDSSDGNVYFSCSYPVDIQEPGIVGVDGKIFHGIIDSCAGTINIATDDKSAKIKHASGRCKLPIVEKDLSQILSNDKPVAPQMEPLKVNGDVLKGFIDRIQFSVSDELGYVDALSCIDFAKSPKGNLVIYGLNGHMLATLNVPPVDFPEEILIQKQYLKHLLKWLDNQYIKVRYSEKHIFFKNEMGERLIIPRTSADFPNCEQMLERITDDASVVKIGRADFVAALRRVQTVNTDIDSSTDLTFDETTMHCGASIENAGDVNEDIGIENFGTMKKISFRTRDLMSILDHLSDSKQITMKMTTETGPCLFTGEDHDYKIILMPLQQVETKYEE